MYAKIEIFIIKYKESLQKICVLDKIYKVISVNSQ